jgi:hypothetical protein
MDSAITSFRAAMYRLKAKHSRVEAQEHPDPELAAGHRDLADGWERLADQTELLLRLEQGPYRGT